MLLATVIACVAAGFFLIFPFLPRVIANHVEQIVTLALGLLLVTVKASTWGETAPCSRPFAAKGPTILLLPSSLRPRKPSGHRPSGCTPGIAPGPVHRQWARLWSVQRNRESLSPMLAIRNWGPGLSRQCPQGDNYPSGRPLPGSPLRQHGAIASGGATTMDTTCPSSSAVPMTRAVNTCPDPRGSIKLHHPPCFGHLSDLLLLIKGYCSTAPRGTVGQQGTLIAAGAAGRCTDSVHGKSTGGA